MIANEQYAGHAEHAWNTIQKMTLGVMFITQHVRPRNRMKSPRKDNSRMATVATCTGSQPSVTRMHMFVDLPLGLNPGFPAGRSPIVIYFNFKC